MDNLFQKPTFGRLQLPAIDARLRPGHRVYVLGPLTEWVPYASRLRRGTVLRLVQAQYHLPGGTFKAQEAFEQAINAFLDQFPEADQPIPEPTFSIILAKNKRLSI